jgi:hypothetical protein
MEFEIQTASGEGFFGKWGNADKIKALEGSKVKIRTLNDLKRIADDVDTNLIIDFKDLKITIYDDYYE